MIKLTRAAKPEYLSDAKVAELTAEFKDKKSSVWNNDNIKSPLLLSSHNKCAYCECNLQKESNYLEVEHFEDKHHNPDKVVLWENLLPACKKCNGAKGTHDTKAEPIVNPYEDDPKAHFALRLYRLKGKTATGTNTIDVTDLNNHSRLVLVRFEVGEKVSQLVNNAWEKLLSYQQNPSSIKRSKLIGIIQGILEECQPTSSYAATTSTVLLTDEIFLTLISRMKEIELWNKDLNELYRKSKELTLDIV